MISESKNIVITGASSGIGYATALEFAKQGHKVYALARNKDNLAKLQAQAELFPGRIVPIVFDLKDFKKDKLEKIFSEVKVIDVLINNAGLLLNKNFLAIKESEILEVLQVNYISVIKCVQFFHSRLMKGINAHILNISSVGGVTGSVKFPGLSIYSSSKGALSILSECLAQDFKEDGIKVNCLALGAVRTEMLSAAFPGFDPEVTPSEMGIYIAEYAINAQKVVNGV
ncbi:MAG: SDR family oxidoreductase, partial [Flavobacteriales bacterium]